MEIHRGDAEAGRERERREPGVVETQRDVVFAIGGRVENAAGKSNGCAQSQQIGRRGRIGRLPGCRDIALAGLEADLEDSAAARQVRRRAGRHRAEYRLSGGRRLAGAGFQDRHLEDGVLGVRGAGDLRFLFYR